MGDRKTRLFKAFVIERYYTCKEVEIISDTEEGLEEYAIELANNVPDGDIYREETEVDIYSEEVIDD